MNFELTNGKGLIEIGLGRGSDLKFTKPLSVVWQDGYGSIHHLFENFVNKAEIRINLSSFLINLS